MFFSDFLLDNTESELVCIDPYSLDDTTAPVNINTKNIFLNNISKSKNFNKLIFKQMFSIDIFNINNKKFNFIYIDGSHTPEGVTIDFVNSINIIEDNGIIWIDDYLFEILFIINFVEEKIFKIINLINLWCIKMNIMKK